MVPVTILRFVTQALVRQGKPARGWERTEVGIITCQWGWL